MKPGAQVQAAIEILMAFNEGPRPIERMLKDWGRKNRYAGSKDRRAIGEHVFGVMRGRGTLSHKMGSSEPRALMIAYLDDRYQEVKEWKSWFDGATHGPVFLSSEEETLLCAEPAPAPRAATLNIPDWLLGDIDQTFGPNADGAMAAMNKRAGVDLRVNILKTTREGALTALTEEGLDVEATPHSPLGLRLVETSHHVSVEQTQTYKKGLVEVQDEGSQLAAAIAGAKSGEQVVDLCAGAGGKTLAMAAAMGNHGQIFAFDTAGTKLKNLKPRLARAGARNVQVKKINPFIQAPNEIDLDLVSLEQAVDLVVLDVPCSGSGTWRRHPDARWRLTEEDLETYCRDQFSILKRGAALVKPGGRLVYITCSILARENGDQVERFVSEERDFAIEDIDLAFPGIRTGGTLQMAPHVTATDGFFVAVLRKG
jgi:16S rRNA (cytosine967-C5)-methyltransferase